MKKKIINVLFILFVLVGLSLLLYPTVSDWWNQLKQSKAIDAYVDEVTDLDESQYEELWEAARKYNDDMKNRENPYYMTDYQKENYDQVLNGKGTGIIGYIEIPAIGCHLPIYHGTSEDVLQRAIGHLDWTSLPIGGEGTHSVVSGHRGLPSAKLFSNLDKVSIGDIFMMHVLNETLTYEVDQILTVEPQETSALLITEGEDLCTLVTCTPYGINTHRLLVRGHRIANIETAKTVRLNSDALKIGWVIEASVAVIPFLVLLVLWLTLTGRKEKKDKK